MKWTKKQTEAIQEQIREYYRKTTNPRYKVKCALCVAFPSCKNCPNGRINKILNIMEEEDKFSCASNMARFIIKFNLSKRRQYKGFAMNKEQIKFRRRMWENALYLTEEHFIKKYK